MASSSELEDALANIHRFGPEQQAKIKLWYPKLEAAQRKARAALADMQMHVLTAPPISVITRAYSIWAEKRKSYVATYDEAWKQYEAIIAEYTKAPAPSCTCGKCSAPTRAAVVEAAPTRPAVAPRRSSRLATKPKKFYYEVTITGRPVWYSGKDYDEASYDNYFKALRETADTIEEHYTKTTYPVRNKK